MKGFGREPTRGDTDVIGARIGAQLVDTIIAGVIIYLSVVLFGGVGQSPGETAAGGLLGLFVGFAAVLFYFFILEGIWDGQTVGKRLLGIKVVKENGDECDIGTSFVRNLLRIIDAIFYYLVGFLVMAFTDNRQRIGDLLAGSVVVRESDMASKS